MNDEPVGRGVAAQQPTSAADERAKFETWAEANGFGKSLPSTWAWQAWQARAALGHQVAAQQPAEAVRGTMADHEGAFKVYRTAAAQPPAPPAPSAQAHSFVQTVPDHCDRIVWRNAYYGLPLTQAALMLDAYGQPRTRYVRVSLGPQYCVMHPTEGDSYLEDAKANGDESNYTQTDVFLSEREFDDLGEFDGF